MIKMLAMDVDGTLTDNTINISDNGELFKSFNVKDGYGIKMIKNDYNIITAVLTGRQSKITENRCKELGIVEICQNVSDK